jgi:hypothetical protein
MKSFSDWAELKYKIDRILGSLLNGNISRDSAFKEIHIIYANFFQTAELIKIKEKLNEIL